MADPFDAAWDAAPGPTATAPGADPFDVAWESTPGSAPTWGQSAKFVGKSAAEGLAGFAGLLADYLPLTGGTERRMLADAVSEKYGPQAANGITYSSQLSNLLRSTIGSSNDVGVSGVVPDLARSAVKAAVVPFGGPVLNAVSGLASEGVKQAGGGEGLQLAASILAPMSVSTVKSGLSSLGSKLSDVADNVAPLSAADETIGSLGITKSQLKKGVTTQGISATGEVPLEKALSGVKERGFFDEGPSSIRLLPEKNNQAISKLGEEASTLLKTVDAAQKDIPNILTPEAYPSTQSYINLYPTQKDALRKQLAENLDVLNKEWDGTISGLNNLKTGFGRDAFGGALTRSKGLDQAFYQDLKDHILSAAESVNPSIKEGVSKLFNQMSEHYAIAPTLSQAVIDVAKQGLNPKMTLTELTQNLGGKLTATAGGVALLSGAPLTAISTLAVLGAQKAAQTNLGKIVGSKLLSGGGTLADKVSKVVPSQSMEKSMLLGSLIQGILGSAENSPVVTNEEGSSPIPPKAQEISMELPKNLEPQFKEKVSTIANNLEIDPKDLMAVMKFETGGSLASDTKNKAGSGATGLIQFMPSTAKDLTGASTKEAAIKIMESMTPIEQLDYVEKYLAPFKGKLNTLEDIYMAVLYPKAVGKDPEYALFEKGTKAYWQNRGLDINEDGVITKAEATSRVREYA